MSHNEKAAQEKRAKALRNQINQLATNDKKRGKPLPPPKSPRDFIHQKMMEMIREKSG